MDMSPQPQPPRLLVDLPSWLLAQVAADAHRLVGIVLDRRQLRRHHFSVLAALHEEGATSQVDLGRRLGLDRSDLHGVLDLLTREQLVTRVRDSVDRRRNLVTLTDEGARVLGALTDDVRGAQDALLEPLTLDERRAFSELLTRLHRHHAAPLPTPGDKATP